MKQECNGQSSWKADPANWSVHTSPGLEAHWKHICALRAAVGWATSDSIPITAPRGFHFVLHFTSKSCWMIRICKTNCKPHSALLGTFKYENPFQGPSPTCWDKLSLSMTCKSPARKATIPNSYFLDTGSTWCPVAQLCSPHNAHGTSSVCTAGGCPGLQDVMGLLQAAYPPSESRFTAQHWWAIPKQQHFLVFGWIFFLRNIRCVTDTYALKIIMDNIFHYFPNAPHGGAEALCSSVSTAKHSAGHPELLPAAVPCPGMCPPPQLPLAGDGQGSATAAQLWPASTTAAAHTCAVQHNCFSIHKQKIVLVLQPANRAELPQESIPHMQQFSQVLRSGQDDAGPQQTRAALPCNAQHQAARPEQG